MQKRNKTQFLWILKNLENIPIFFVKRDLNLLKIGFCRMISGLIMSKIEPNLPKMTLTISSVLVSCINDVSIADQTNAYLYD